MRSSPFTPTMLLCIFFSPLTTPVAHSSFGDFGSPKSLFEVEYKKVKANTQAYALSYLNNVGEPTSHDDSEVITVFLLYDTGLELQLNKTDDETDLTDVQYTNVDKVYAAMNDTAPRNPTFELIEVEEILC